MKTIFFRILEAVDKAPALLAAIGEPAKAMGRQRFEVQTASFAAVPSSPFAYWVSEKLRQLFVDFPAFESDGRVARQGGVTGDDFRWLRIWLETDPRQGLSRHVPIAKGGSFSPFYADLALQASWDSSRDTFWAFTGLPHRPSLKPASFNFYFRPGLTWPLRTNGLSVRALPAGCIFSHKGPSVFIEGDDGDDLLALAAVTNSKAFALLVSLQLARTELAQSYEVGLIQRTPIPKLNPVDRSRLSGFARRAWSLKRSLDTCTETSRAFVQPALLQVEGQTLVARANAWRERIRAADAELGAIRNEIDELCLELYGISEAELRAITDGLGAAAAPGELAGVNSVSDPELDDEDDSGSGVEPVDLATELVAWAVGVALGRFDVRIATGARSIPAEPSPFDRLPVCSPAMLTDENGRPEADAPKGYPVTFPENGILVDDAGHVRDLVAAVREVFEGVFKASADSWWNDVEALLDPKDRNLRAWLSSNFFGHHLKKHSKNRRKAPIVWQLAVPSGRYSVWLYVHRLNRDSFIQIQNDFVAPKLAHEERQLTSLLQGAGAAPSANERKEIETQEAFVAELRELLEEVARVAPLWHPTFDDGVAITMAPLWRLVPQHKPWQKELKSRWNELAAGKHDWSLQAMHLWPERVVPKCTTDRSLAIAHGLEDVFWFQENSGKWKAYEKPAQSIVEVIRDRASTVTKGALKALLGAPERASIPKRGRRTKAA
ncbi:hypothetical protein [Bradyrhizobium sp. RDI18]|uniref:hypothetical protein n=1 Tax=Bradyrhizobium sp. RDI18 TaxID=3367400 RepID=UPI00371F0C90